MPFRRILVTGANKGIGFAIVKRLLSETSDVFVYLGSRSQANGDSAVAALLSEHPHCKDRVECLQLDVSDPSSVAAAASSVSAKLGSEGKLFAIVNNAGIGFGHSHKEVFKTNVLGPKYVCDAFIPLLQTSGGRVVMVSSASGPMFVAKCSPERQDFFRKKTITWEEIESVMEELTTCTDFAAAGFGENDEAGYNSYGASKALLNLYTMYLAAKYKDLMVTACTPGFIETDLTASVSGDKKQPYEGTHSPFHCLFGSTNSGYFYGSDCLRSPLHAYRSPGSPAYEE